MKKYMIFFEPEKGEPFRFVIGMRRRLLLWKRVVYSHLPIPARVDDDKQLMDLQVLAMKEAGRTVRIMGADDFESGYETNQFYALRERSDDVEAPMWFTGRWYRNDGRMRLPNGRKPQKVAEVSADLCDAQLFVRERYAIEALSRLNSECFSGVLERLYVNVTNIFFHPCIVTVCMNKHTGRTRYLKSYKEDDHRLRYSDALSEALLLYPEESEKVYEYLIQKHKDLSFTMIVKPDEDLSAMELRLHEKELVQRVACDFYLRQHGKKAVE